MEKYRQFKYYSHWKKNLYIKPYNKEDKSKLRKEIEDATAEYLKNNTITHLPNSPDVKVESVKVKYLREISDTEEFAYLEEEHEHDYY